MTVKIPDDWKEEPGLVTKLSVDQLVRDVEWYKDILPALEQKSDDDSRLLVAIYRQRLSNRQEELRRREKSQTKAEVNTKRNPKPEAGPKSRTKTNGRLPREVIDRVKERVSVLDYFSDRFGTPRKQGNTYVASCPFPSHQDRNLSFTVYPDTNRWFCAECRKGGDVIDFVRELHGLGFVEAIQHLLPMAAEGVSPPEGTKMQGSERVRHERRNPLPLEMSMGGEKARRRIAIKDGRRPGWHWASHEIIDIYGAKLGPYGLAIYYALCRHANQNGECWPSYTTLAEETGMSRDMAIRMVKRLLGEEEGLEEVKLIEKQTRQYEQKGPTSNLYFLLEIPTLVTDNDQPSGCERPDLVADSDPNNNNVKKNKRKPSSTTEASLFEKLTDNPKEDAKDSVSDKERVLRDFGLRGSVVAEIAKSRNMNWIRAAMVEMDNPSPGGVVYLHREGWEPPSEEDDTITSIYCSECGDLENLCTCSDPKPRRVLHSELKRLQERRRADALGSAAVPDLDRLQRFSDVHKRFPDTPHELLEFEARLNER